MHRDKFAIAVLLSVALHALGVYMAVQYALPRNSKLEAAPPEEHVIRLEMVQIPPKLPPAVPPPERPAMAAVSTTRRGLTPGELTAFLGHMKSLFGAQAGLVNADAKRLRVLLNRLLPHEDTP